MGEFYDKMRKVLKNHGEEICKTMNAVCAYRITNLRGTDDEVTLVMDMRRGTNLQTGAIVLNPRDDTESKILRLGVET